MKKFKTRRKNLSGLKLAAAYGMAPNKLGFCGPQGENDCKKILHYLENKKSDLKIRPILEKFEAAYAYFELIARKNKIQDPLDFRVVEAFWVGNALLKKVSVRDIKRMVLDKFTQPRLLSKNEAKKRIKFIPKNSFPHHSFHVYILGTITGRVSLEDAFLKDICRVGWGRVKKIKNSGKKYKVIIEYKPIVRNKKFEFGRLNRKEVDWNKKILPNIKVGDQVSFHWNVLCQKLSPKDVLNLEKYTEHTLKSLNL